MPTEWPSVNFGIFGTRTERGKYDFPYDPKVWDDSRVCGNDNADRKSSKVDTKLIVVIHTNQDSKIQYDENDGNADLSCGTPSSTREDGLGSRQWLHLAPGKFNEKYAIADRCKGMENSYAYNVETAGIGHDHVEN